MAKPKRPDTEQPYLIVYGDRSILHDGMTEEEFLEGKPDKQSKERLKKIKEVLGAGFLKNVIDSCMKPDVEIGNLKEQHKEIIGRLLNFTSEIGRALVGLSILQLCIKCITPEQSIRLHKAGRGDFSWQKGVPMRTLDKQFITPVLREYNLLKLNAFGFMMTRSLAENYPYSTVYKAAVRGARTEWLSIVDLLERKEIDPEAALRYTILQLVNRSSSFLKMVDETTSLSKIFLETKPTLKDITSFIKEFVDSSTYSARVFEVAIHSVYQVLNTHGLLSGELKPLSQMRSANKKHGNIGDVEVVSEQNEFAIIEAWDAKYGKPYLRDELEELTDKLASHHETELVGFVVNETPVQKGEILDRIEELEEMFDIEMKIIEFEAFVKYQSEKLDGVITTDQFAQEWFLSFVESLCQKRRHIAPIDEPCDKWVEELNQALKLTLL